MMDIQCKRIDSVSSLRKQYNYVAIHLFCLPMISQYVESTN